MSDDQPQPDCKRVAVYVYNCSFTENEIGIVMRGFDRVVGSGVVTAEKRETRPGFPYYFTHTLSDNWPKVHAVAHEVYELVRPQSLAVAQEERAIAEFIHEMDETGAVEYCRESESPLYRLCMRLEYKTLDEVFADLLIDKKLDIWCDGFYPEIVNLEQGNCLCVEGRCYTGRVFKGVLEGRFRGRMRLGPRRGTLAEFDLAFADADAMTKDGVISREMPEIYVGARAGYEVIVRKGSSYAADDSEKWAFRITKKANTVSNPG